MSDWVSLIGWGVTVAALGLAVKQMFDARQQTRDLKFVSGALTTRYLGAFPSFLAAATDLVDAATTELLIVVGNPLPAYFSDPLIYSRFSSSVKAAARRGVLVQLVCMGERLRRQRLDSQFVHESEDLWSEWKVANAALLHEFLRFRFAGTDATTLTNHGFLDLLSTVQRDLLNEDYRLSGVVVHEVDEFVPVQTWIADRASAVFSVQNTSRQSMSHGLYTSDVRFVEALLAMAEMYMPDTISDDV